MARDSFLQRNENERPQHDDDDDDDEEKDGFDAFVVGVDVRVRLCSSGAFEALVALGDDAGGLGARFDEASSAFGVGRFGKLLLARIKTCHWGSYWKTN